MSMFDADQKAAYAVYWVNVDCKQDNAHNDALSCLSYSHSCLSALLCPFNTICTCSHWLTPPSWQYSVALCLWFSATLNQAAVSEGPDTAGLINLSQLFYFFSWHCSGAFELKPNVGAPGAAHSPIHHLCPCTVVSISDTLQAYSSYYFLTTKQSQLPSCFAPRISLQHYIAVKNKRLDLHMQHM